MTGDQKREGDRGTRGQGDAAGHVESPEGLPSPVREALADRSFMDGVREAIAETAPPVPLRHLQDEERARRARHV
jgi:hypothetical protein